MEYKNTHQKERISKEEVQEYNRVNRSSNINQPSRKYQYHALEMAKRRF
jgi:hypothetical protein